MNSSSSRRPRADPMSPPDLNLLITLDALLAGVVAAVRSVRGPRASGQAAPSVRPGA